MWNRASLKNENQNQRKGMRELTDAELEKVAGGAQSNKGGGPGNSGPGDKHSPVEGPPPGRDHNFKH